MSVTATGLSATGTICAPADGTWSQVGQKMFLAAAGNKPSLTQQTFKSFRVGANAESYDSTFATATCDTSAGTNPPASAVLVRYTGVDPANPIDKEQGAAGTGTRRSRPQ